MAFLMLPGLFEIAHPDQPWYIRAPEQWVYPIQTIVVAGVLAFFWKHYTFRPFRGMGLAVLLGFLTIAIWVLPSHLYTWLGFTHAEGETAWRFLGITPRLDGFDPTVFSENKSAQLSAIGMRFVRMVCLVPFVEELFWRGFLMRWLVDTDRDFRKTPFGTWHFKAVAITTLMVTLAHSPVDWIGALVFGSAMAWLAIRTKSLGACVVMHAVANLVLGIYVLVTGNYGFW